MQPPVRSGPKSDENLYPPTAPPEQGRRVGQCLRVDPTQHDPTGTSSEKKELKPCHRSQSRRQQRSGPQQEEEAEEEEEAEQEEDLAAVVQKRESAGNS